MNTETRYERRAMSNGATVFFVIAPQSSNLYLSVDFAVGSAHEQPHQYGGAHMLEHALFLGTETRDRQSLWDAGRAWRGTRNAATMKHSTVFDCTNLKGSYVDPAARGKAIMGDAFSMIDHLSDMLLRPIFPETLTRREIERVANEIGWSHDTGSLFYNHVAPSFFEAPYDRSIAGGKADVRRLQHNDIVDLYGQSLVAENMSVWVAAPEIDIDAIMNVLETRFSALPHGEKAERLTATLKPNDVRHHVSFYEQNRIDILLQQQTPRDPFQAAVQIAGRMMAGARLDKAMDASCCSYTYNIQSLMEPGALAYNLTAYPDPDQTESCATQFLEVTRAISQHVTKTDFDAHRSGRRFMLNVENPSSAFAACAEARYCQRHFGDFVLAAQQRPACEALTFDAVLDTIDGMTAKVIGTAAVGPNLDAMPTLSVLAPRLWAAA